MRKLVSVKTITDIQPIPNADAIEVVEISHGWKCVSKKGEFQKGDKCIYFEIDSFLPLIPEFEFLRKSSYKKMGEKEGIRLKTIKLRGQISQGLALPINALKHLIPEDIELTEGTDLTEILNVEKYEPPIPASIAGEVVGLFPSFIQKTDQERIQNLWEEFHEKYKDIEFEVTIKLDGSSMTVFQVDKEKFGSKTEIGVCSRNLQLKESAKNTLWKVARESILDDLDTFFKETGRSIALQGELMGPGIQKNREKFNKHKFFLYDIFDIDKGRKLTREERQEVLKWFPKVEEVPYLGDKKIFNEVNSLQEILDMAEGDSINSKVREGLVFKSNELVNGNQISFKAISNKFLLKGGD